jgi:hypothetical protein
MTDKSRGGRGPISFHFASQEEPLSSGSGYNALTSAWSQRPTPGLCQLLERIFCRGAGHEGVHPKDLRKISNPDFPK